MIAIQCKSCGWQSDPMDQGALLKRGLPWYCDECGGRVTKFVRGSLEELTEWKEEMTEDRDPTTLTQEERRQKLETLITEAFKYKAMCHEMDKHIGIILFTLNEVVKEVVSYYPSAENFPSIAEAKRMLVDYAFEEDEVQ